MAEQIIQKQRHSIQFKLTYILYNSHFFIQLLIFKLLTVVKLTILLINEFS